MVRVTRAGNTYAHTRTEWALHGSLRAGTAAMCQFGRQPRLSSAARTLRTTAGRSPARSSLDTRTSSQPYSHVTDWRRISGWHCSGPQDRGAVDAPQHVVKVRLWQACPDKGQTHHGFGLGVGAHADQLERLSGRPDTPYSGMVRNYGPQLRHRTQRFMWRGELWAVGAHQGVSGYNEFVQAGYGRQIQPRSGGRSEPDAVVLHELTGTDGQASVRVLLTPALSDIQSENEPDVRCSGSGALCIPEFFPILPCRGELSTGRRPAMHRDGTSRQCRSPGLPRNAISRRERGTSIPAGVRRPG